MMNDLVQLGGGAIMFCVVLAGCGSSFTTEEATDVCDRQREVQASCFDDQAMSQCISCHQECGRDCSQLESCPLQFSCD